MILLALALWQLINSKILPQHKDIFVGEQLVTGNTGSMEPYLHTNDITVVVSIKFSDVKAGDLVLRRVNWTYSGWVLHRATNRFGGGWITCGDHNKSNDPGWMMEDDFIAIVKKL